MGRGGRRGRRWRSTAARIRRAHRAGAARAVLGVAGALPAIRADLDGDSDHVSSVHLGESAEELEFLRAAPGRGAICSRRLAPGPRRGTAGGSPVEYLADLGFLDCRVLVVHGVQFTGDDLARLRALGTTIVSCPRSNRHVGVGSPPLEAFYAMGVAVAFGTDSLRERRRSEPVRRAGRGAAAAPRVPARALLESATLCRRPRSASARTFGSIDSPASARRSSRCACRPACAHVEEYLGGDDPAAPSPWRRRPSASTATTAASSPGDRPAHAVRMPDGVSDVEEYLVSGSASSIVTSNHDQARHLPVVRPLQPLGVRAAVRVDGRAAGVARRIRSPGRRSPGSSSAW